MKKAFFMVGILAALSMTAFGAEAAKEAVHEIALKGVSVKELKLTSLTTEINFGKVMIGGSKISDDITLSLDGEKEMSVSLSTDIAGITDVAFVESKGIGLNEKVPLDTAGKGSKTIALVYSPTTDADLEATLKITATYDDIAE